MSGFVETQAEVERRALGLLALPAVRAAVEAQERRWREGTPGFLPETYDRLRTSIDEVALLVALQVVAGDRYRAVEISAGPHTWGGVEVPGGRWGINNPDTLYFASQVSGGSGYVLRASPPSGERPTDVNISVQTPDVWGTLDSLGLRDLVLDEGGGFSISMGDVPVAGTSNHLPLRDGGTVLMVRQTLADWTTELPYALTIEQTTGPPPGPEPGDEHLVQELVDRLDAVIDHSLDDLQPPVFTLPVNTVPQPGAAGDKAGYLVAQRNTLGHFRLADDEALVLEIAPGGAAYAAVATTDIWGVTTDSAQHHNSLNSRQAVLGPGESFIAVVANHDPGVVNWVDPGGLREGIVMLRWQLLAEGSGDHGEPAVEARLVRIDDLRASLPTLRSWDAGEQQSRRRARAVSYARRFELR